MQWPFVSQQETFALKAGEMQLARGMLLIWSDQRCGIIKAPGMLHFGRGSGGDYLKVALCPMFRMLVRSSSSGCSIHASSSLRSYSVLVLGIGTSQSYCIVCDLKLQTGHVKAWVSGAFLEKHHNLALVGIRSQGKAGLSMWAVFAWRLLL